MGHPGALSSQEGGSAAVDGPQILQEESPPGAVMSLDLPLEYRQGAAGIIRLQDEDLPKQEVPAPAPATPGWTTILFEDAEGSFPTGNGWNVFDNNAASGEDYWDDLTCRSYGGSWSVWSADIGDQTDCVNYDNDMTSWMIFGPFSLADATDARAEFRVWSETERPDIPYDYFFWGASANGSNFSGFRLTSNTTWSLAELDLTNVPTLGDLTGDSSVWFGLVFVSDSSVNNFEGTYVDDILIEKLVPAQVDLVATEVFFRDQPQNGGNIINDPTPSDILYPHFLYTVNSSGSVTGKIWEIEINNSPLCSLTTTEPPGSRVGWCNSPISLLPGLHSLHGELDPDQTIGESNENNNDAFHNYNVSGPPGTFTLSNEPPVCDTQPPGPSPAVRLNWTTSSGATSYDVYRNGGLYSSGITGNTFYNSANVVAGQTYSYFIRANSSSGDTDSNTISVPIPSDICGPDIRIEPLTLTYDSQAPAAIGSDGDGDRILLKSRQFSPSATSGPFKVFAGRRHLILQFEGAPHEGTFAALADLAVRILHPVPRNAVLASVPGNTDLSVVPGIRWVGSLGPGDKVSRGVERAMIEGSVVVDFFADVDGRHARAIVEAAGGWVVPNPYLLPTSLLVVGGIEVVYELSLADEVSWIRAASAAEIAGEELFHCPGGQTPLGNVANFVIHDDGWDGPGQGTAHDLLFHFDNGTADISGTLEEPEVARGFFEWTQHAAVTYTETNTGNLNRSMDVAWATGDHGDGSPFDGTGGVLAHNFYPSPPNPEPIAGDMHFDDDETWRIGPGTGFDLFTVALHEAGHGLGLGHSDVAAAVMFPSISSSTIFTELHADDIAGIQSIYASAGGAESFTVFNDGEESLSVTSISPDAPAAWISWSPSAPFSVPAGGSEEVLVMVDFGGAPSGQSTRRLLVTSNDSDESPYPGGVNIIVNNTSCYLLSLSHTGSGSDPVPSPSSSSGCPSGQYNAGESISLTANPSNGWQVGSWNGTVNDSSTSTLNSVSMPASAHSASVNYVQAPEPCYVLSVSHTGSGGDPVASPSSSSGCSSGQYHAGQSISLTASPNSGWEVGSWSGTSDDSSTSTANGLVMPGSAHSVSVHYVQSTGPPMHLVLANQTLGAANVYEACESITLGPNLFIGAGGAGVVVRSPLIIFVSEVRVLVGAVATFENSTPAGCP